MGGWGFWVLGALYVIIDTTGWKEWTSWDYSKQLSQQHFCWVYEIKRAAMLVSFVWAIIILKISLETISFSAVLAVVML